MSIAEAERFVDDLAKNPQLLTPAFAANLWFFKPGWRNVDDLTCEGGTGRSFHWADASSKATLGSLK